MANSYKSLIFIFLSAVFLLSTSLSIAGDVNAGEKKAVACAACYGANGISSIGIYPNLAGQQEQYLVSAIKAYKDGSRANPLMGPMVAPLSDDDINNLAAYYSSITPE